MATFRNRRSLGVVIGVLIALVIPVSNLLVATLWANGVIQPDPNGSLVQALEAPGLAGILAAPIGVVMPAWFASFSSFAAWLVLIVLLIPMLTILWFGAVASLGGLAGEPF